MEADMTKYKLAKSTTTNPLRRTERRIGGPGSPFHLHSFTSTNSRTTILIFKAAVNYWREVPLWMYCDLWKSRRYAHNVTSKRWPFCCRAISFTCKQISLISVHHKNGISPLPLGIAKACVYICNRHVSKWLISTETRTFFYSQRVLTGVLENWNPGETSLATFRHSRLLS